MKQKISLCIIIALFVSAGLLADGVLPEGSGSEASPYLIENAENLLWISTNSASWSSYFSQTGYIDASYLTSWNPIGYYTTYFTGTYNGNGYVIDGLHCTHPYASSRGLFGVINSGAVLANIGLTNVEMNGDDYIGALVGYTYDSYISNCYSTGLARGQSHVGGLVGYNWCSSITDCYSSATVTINELGHDTFGGLVGFSSYGTISNCYSTGSVTAVADVGGFVGGTSLSAAINNCYSTGWVYCSNNYGGGFVGINTQNSTISNCYSTGTVTGNYPYPWGLGGFVGGNYDSAAINNCYSTGSVNNGDGYCGGFAGKNLDSALISNCYSMGSVNGTTYVGGFLGLNYTSAITNNCYSKGSVTGNSEIGGFAGAYWGGSVTNSFWDIETSGQTTSYAGTGKTTAEMNDVATFTDESTTGLLIAWDFVCNPNDDSGNDDYWNIYGTINNGYPFLSWQSGIVVPCAPTNVIISIVNDNIQITWDAVTGATSYKIYSSDNPYTGFTEDNTGAFNDESWTAAIPDVKKFYYVKAENQK